MTTQAQIIAVEASARKEALEAEGTFKAILNNESLYTGIIRNYNPIDDEGEKFPSETKYLALDLEQTIRNLFNGHKKLFDVTATKDWGNQEATGDIVVGDYKFDDVPVHYLLFLEKTLTRLKALIQSVPVLSPTERWNALDSGWETDAIRTAKSRKIPTVIVKYDATPEHPAQTEMFLEDQTVGHWITHKLSGALDPSTRNGLIERTQVVLDAVAMARERANQTEVDNQYIAIEIFEFIIGD